MKRKIITALLITVLLWLLCACSAITTALNEKNIVGAWRLVDGNGGKYGVGLMFNEDLTLGFALDLNTDESFDSQQFADALTNAIGGIYSVTYEIISETEIELTSSVLLGLSSQTEKVDYTLNGDTLVFNGSTYERIS